MSKLYLMGVVGNPIAHSLSPTIFNYFAKEFAINLSYKKILANIINNDFQNIITQFFNANGFALNITSPFKHQAYLLANSHSDDAKLSLSANLLYCDHSINILSNVYSNKLKTWGHDKQQDIFPHKALNHEDIFLNNFGVGYSLIAGTTDGIGLYNDITYNCQLDISQKKILIIGSGHVVPSIINTFLQHTNRSNISVFARNITRLQYLLSRFKVNIISLESLLMINKNDIFNKYDIIINTTPNHEDNNLISYINAVKNEIIAYDISYSCTQENRFLSYMKNINKTTMLYNGLGMLIEQAKATFTQLFNHIPNTKIVYKDLIKLIK